VSLRTQPATDYVSNIYLWNYLVSWEALICSKHSDPDVSGLEGWLPGTEVHEMADQQRYFTQEALPTRWQVVTPSA